MSTQYDALVATMNAKYSTEQLNYFKQLCDSVNREELTMNQAFKQAKGYSNLEGDTTDKPNGGFMGSFNLWVQNAVDNGWIQQGAQVWQGAKNNLETTGSILKKTESERKNMLGTVIAFTVIAAAIGFSAYIIYKNKKK